MNDDKTFIGGLVFLDEPGLTMHVYLRDNPSQMVVFHIAGDGREMRCALDAGQAERLLQWLVKLA